MLYLSNISLIQKPLKVNFRRAPFGIGVGFCLWVIHLISMSSFLLIIKHNHFCLSQDLNPPPLVNRAREVDLVGKRAFSVWGLKWMFRQIGMVMSKSVLFKITLYIILKLIGSCVEKIKEKKLLIHSLGRLVWLMRMSQPMLFKFTVGILILKFKSTFLKI